MGDIEFTIQRLKFVGFGVGWNRRDAFSCGWITLQLPFFEIIVEWPRDWDAWDAEYEAGVKR